MIEFDKNLASGMEDEEEIKPRVTAVTLPENVHTEDAANAVAYVLAHTFNRARDMEDVLFELRYIIRELSTVKDNIDPFR